MTRTTIALAGIALLCLSAATPKSLPWGFYGHRLINRMAVFILPTEMVGVFKHHIEYLTEHAVDPDKRRYASRHEAVRHYIDLDHWGVYPFSEVPRNWADAIAQNLVFFSVGADQDTQVHYRTHDAFWGKDLSATPEYKRLMAFTRKHVMPNYYESEWKFAPDTIRSYFPAASGWDAGEILVLETFSEHGIAPYHLQAMYHRLTKAFADKDLHSILRLAADMGHYVGDAHVPLHTTQNYDGQMTGQEGIHAFWESRIPELFAEEEFDFWVGKAKYIEDTPSFFWEIVIESHQLVPTVLEKEMELRNGFPADRQYCHDERLGTLILTQCREYAQAYRESMNGLVEKRMRETIKALGDIWYSAWIDAGQPELDELVYGEKTDAEIEEAKLIEEKFRAGKPLGRKHLNH